MSERQDKWVVSYDDEIFLTNYFFDTVDEAIEFGKAEYDNLDGFYIGQVFEEPVNTDIEAMSILEVIAEDVYEQFGEVAQDYLMNVKGEHVVELENALNNVIKHWMDYYNYNPSYFKVDNIQFISLEEDDNNE